MRALRHLRQLVRVAEQDERAGARPGGEDVGERELAGLVDEQHVERPLALVDVELRQREGPAGAGDEVDRGIEDVGLVVRRDDAATRELRARLGLVLAALDAPEREALRVCLVLDRAQQVVDRLVAERGDADALALRASARSPCARPARSCPIPAVPARTGSSPRARAPPSPDRQRAERPAGGARAARRARGTRLRRRRHTPARSGAAPRGSPSWESARPASGPPAAARPRD